MHSTKNTRRLMFRVSDSLEYVGEVESIIQAEQMPIDSDDTRLLVVIAKGEPVRWFAWQTDVEQLQDDRRGVRIRQAWNEIIPNSFDPVENGLRLRVTNWVEHLDYNVPIPPGMVEAWAFGGKVQFARYLYPESDSPFRLPFANGSAWHIPSSLFD